MVGGGVRLRAPLDSGTLLTGATLMMMMMVIMESAEAAVKRVARLRLAARRWGGYVLVYYCNSCPVFTISAIAHRLC